MSDAYLRLLSNALIEKIPAIMNMSSLPNIYFVGKAGAGKSYSANFLIKKYNFQVAKFAHPVYMIAEKYFNMKNKNRKLLQIIGTDAARDNINSEIWINRFKEDMQIVKLTAKIMNLIVPKFVMDDCRFLNEHKILQQMGFIGIYINVSDKIREKRLENRDGMSQINTLQHKSETVIDTFKDKLIQLDGNGSLEESYCKLNKLLQQITNKK